MSLYYHPGKANVVADTLSRLSMGILSNVSKEKQDLMRDIHRFANLRVHLLDSEDGGVFVQEVAKSSLGAKAIKK